MYGNKMIGTVFFLAFAAPLMAVQYPTTASYATEAPPTYPEPYYQTTTSYEPPTYAEPSYERPTTSGYSGPAYSSPTSRPSYPSSTQKVSYSSSSYEPSNPAPSYEPSNPAPSYEPSNPAPSYEPSNNSPSYEPSNPSPTYAPSNPSPTYAPSNPSPTYAPSNPSPTYAPSNPSPSYESNNPAPTYETNNPAPTYESSNPAPTYESNNPAPTYESSNPAPTYESNNPAPTYESSSPSPSYEPRNPSPSYEPNSPPSNYEPGYDNNAAYGNEYNQAHAPYNTPYDLFSHFPIAPAKNLGKVLEDLRQQIIRVIGNNKILTDSLDIIDRKVNSTTAFIEELTGKQFPLIVAKVDDKEKEIAFYRNLITSYRGLNDDISALNDTAGTFNRRLLDARARNTATVTLIEKIEDGNAAQNLSFVTVSDQADGIDQLIEITNNTRSNNVARYAAVIKNLTGLTKIINEERIDLFTAVLSPSNSSVDVRFEIPYNITPQLAWSINGIKIDRLNGNNSGSSGTNNYKSGSYGTNDYNKSGSSGTNAYKAGYSGTNQNSSGSSVESIQPRVSVVGDRNGFTVRLADNSTNFRTQEVTVQVLVLRVNNDNFPSVDYSTTAPPPKNYPAPGGRYTTQGQQYSR